MTQGVCWDCLRCLYCLPLGTEFYVNNSWPRCRQIGCRGQAPSNGYRFKCATFPPSAWYNYYIAQTCSAPPSSVREDTLTPGLSFQPQMCQLPPGGHSEAALLITRYLSVMFTYCMFGEFSLLLGPCRCWSAALSSVEISKRSTLSSARHLKRTSFYARWGLI